MKDTSFKQVLFICTGNYYRSRFAEALFNFLADLKSKQHPTSWRAFSRGLDIKLLSQEQRKLTLSEHTTKQLNRMKIPLTYAGGKPTQFVETDLSIADRVIGLSDREHRPYFEKGFPAIDLKGITFWNIEDIDKTEPEAALEVIRAEVEILFRKLED